MRETVNRKTTIPVAKDESFRDHLGTIDESGGRKWIYPKKPKGKLYNARTVVSIFLLAILFGGPFIKINGHPILMLNILERKFYIFGLTFWPQDFHLFALAGLTFLVFIILFTVIFGRVFCGWACPQTIFMEMVFRKIEYWIEGDAHKQRALNKAPWNSEKIAKKVSKHAIFYAIAFLIGNTFLAYIIGIDKLFRIVTDPPSEHLGGLAATLIFSTMFYGVFAWLREQVCCMICPYGRLQGVLLDDNSIVVAYDYVRGEPRGPVKKNQSREKLGDCVNCRLCVQVCPTGIDIRNGTQLECVNCTACIDACNGVMEKVGFPKNLIRYASQKGIAENKKLTLSPRIIGYTLVLLILIGSLGYLMSRRTPVETTILRTPGMLYRITDAGNVQNLYNIQVVNKSFEQREITLRANRVPAKVSMVTGQALTVKPDTLVESAFFVEIPADFLHHSKTTLTIEILDRGKIMDRVKTSFIGPEASSKQKTAE